MTRFVHTADWHLSSQRNRLDTDTGLNARLMDFYRCGRFTVEDGIARGAQMILHAGDAFHGCRPTPTEVRLFREAIGPALEAGVPVVLLLGNHDAPRSSVERHALDLLRDTVGLTIVDQPALLYAQGFETAERNFARLCKPEQAEIQIACLPYPNKQLLLADEEHRKLDPGQLNELMREKVMDCLRGLAAQLLPNIPAVLLGHFSVDMAQAGGQNRLMMLGGEWTINVHDLAALPFSYCALGHIHKQQMVGDQPHIWYCGSPEAVTFGEEKEDKAFLLVSLEANGRAEINRVSTPHRRFVTVELGEGAVLPSPEELAGAIVRVRIPQAQEMDFNALRRELEAAGVHEYQIETERAEAVRRRAVEMSSEMALDEAIKVWLEQRPDLQPMTEALLAEAHNVETALTTAGGLI
jgi:exonuclease SbcD